MLLTCLKKSYRHLVLKPIKRYCIYCLCFTYTIKKHYIAVVGLNPFTHQVNFFCIWFSESEIMIRFLYFLINYVPSESHSFINLLHWKFFISPWTNCVSYNFRLFVHVVWLTLESSHQRDQAYSNVKINQLLFQAMLDQKLKSGWLKFRNHST